MHALPSLNAIRAFEAAARNGSFSLAASELHVTQGAISRHIKTLEQSLNCQLFLRHPQGVELTAAGAMLLPDLTASFERIANAVRQVSASDRELRIIAAPTLSIRWLMPYLQRYNDENPDVRISSSWFKSSYSEFLEGGYDIGIDCESVAGVRPGGMESVYLISEALAPVCSPKYLEQVAPIDAPGDLLNCTLIHPSPDRWDWKLWFGNAGIEAAGYAHERLFDTMEMSITAAMSGMGVAVIDLNFIQSELANRRLVVAYDLVVREGTGYYLFTQRGRFQERKIRDFTDWILQQVQSEASQSRALD